LSFIVTSLMLKMNGKRNIEIEIDLLWQQFLAGDDSALDRLYKNCIRILFFFGLQITSDRELVKDCIQDIFVKLYETKKQLHHVTNVLNYFRIALKNRIINEMRREEIHLRYLNALEFTDVDDLTGEKQMEWLEEEQLNRKRMEAILKVLTPKQKQVITYRYIDNLKLEEISTLMKINYQSVQNTLQRAMIKIKKHFCSEK